MNFPYAEDLNYWKTGKSTPDTWLDKAEKIIEDLGGTVSVRATGKMENRQAFLIDFTFGEDRFRLIWPVLPTQRGEDKAAKRQAATMLFYDVKTRALRAAIFGNRVAFFEFLLLSNNKTASQLSVPEINNYIPKGLLTK